VHLPHERADLPPLTGVIMPDGTRLLFAPRGIGADQVVALFRYGIRVPDSFAEDPVDAWIRIMSNEGLNYIMFSYSASASHMWVDYGGLLDPLHPPNWMWMRYDDAGLDLNVQLTCARAGEAGHCFESHHGGAHPGSEVFRYARMRETGTVFGTVFVSPTPEMWYAAGRPRPPRPEGTLARFESASSFSSDASPPPTDDDSSVASVPGIGLSLLRRQALSAPVSPTVSPPVARRNPASPAAGVRFGEAANPGPPGYETLEELRRIPGVIVVPISPTHAGLPPLVGVQLTTGERRLFAATEIPAGSVSALMTQPQLLPLAFVNGSLTFWLAGRTVDTIHVEHFFFPRADDQAWVDAGAMGALTHPAT
jgi:hypothetical protein